MPLYHDTVRMRRGTSLIELSIVLAIMGMILAAVYSAMGVTRAEARINRGIEEIDGIITNVRSYYGGKALPTGLGNCSGLGYSSSYRMPADWTTAQHEGYGIFPKHMIFSSGSSATLIHALNQGAPQTVMVDFCGSNPVRMAVRFSNVSKTDCTKMIVRSSSHLSESGLTEVRLNGSALARLNDGSVSISTASTQCDGASDFVSIDWLISLNQ